MPDSYDEREVKLDVPADFVVPDLAGAISGATVVRSTIRLASTYYDTSEHALLAHHVTLRRRTGDADVGWQLKVPGKSVRTEIRVPLDGSDGVPERLAELVTGISRGADLEPVAEVRTERQVHRLAHADGEVEVADDYVHATTSGAVLHVREWREVEAELVRGPERLLRKVDRRLRDAGAVPSASASKLAQALGRTPVTIDGPDVGAGDLVRAYLDEQLAVIGSGDIALRRGLDPVHRTRVATRRFRSVLRVLAAAFDGPTAGVLDAELSWAQGLLGEVRDREVLRTRFATAIAELPAELVLGPVAADIEQTLLREQLAAREALMTGLDSRRYRRVLADAVAFVELPPLRAGLTVTDLDKLAASAQRKARKRLARAVRSGDAIEMHRARKALKRARYAAELVRPVEGKRAKRAVRADKRAQDVLGEHQDSTVAADVLLRLGASLGSGAERNGFTYGLLWQREQELAARAWERAGRLRFG